MNLIYIIVCIVSPRGPWSPSGLEDLDLLFYVAFNSQGHIATGSLWVEEPVHTSWSGFCTVNHRVLVSNYQLSNMKRPDRDWNRRPQRLEASTLTTTPPSPLVG